jgi:hypothetical protein
MRRRVRSRKLENPLLHGTLTAENQIRVPVRVQRVRKSGYIISSLAFLAPFPAQAIGGRARSRHILTSYAHCQSVQKISFLEACVSAVKGSKVAGACSLYFPKQYPRATPLARAVDLTTLILPGVYIGRKAEC